MNARKLSGPGVLPGPPVLIPMGLTIAVTRERV